MMANFKILGGLLLVMIVAASAMSQELKPSPVPPLPPPAVPAPPVIPSNISLPVSAPAPDLGFVEQEACDFFKDNVDTPIGNVKFELWRKKPLQEVRLSGNTFSVGAFLYYFVDAGLLAQCGWDDEPAREVLVGADSKIKWGRRWSLESQTAIRPFACPRPDPNDPICRCRLTGANIDVTNLLYRQGQRVLEGVARKFDQSLKEKSSFQGAAARFWGSLQEPVDLGGSRRWLVVQPVSVSAGPITVSNANPQIISTVFALTANPKVILGDKPDVSLTPLPDLEVVPDPTGIHVSTDVETSFDEATRILQDPQTGVIGKKFISGRRELEITGVKLYGTGEKVALELQVKGRAIKGDIPEIVDVVTLVESSFKHIRYWFEKKFYKLKGKIYLTGTPTYMAAERTITFPDLEYDIETRNVIVKIANWILKTKLTERLRADVKLPIGDKLDTLKSNLSNSLNRPIGDNATLRGKVDRLALDRIFVGNNVIMVRILLDGEAELIVDWK